MSHVATVEIQIKDLEALKTACKSIGLIFKENQKSYKWYGSWQNDYSASNAAYKAGIDPKDYGKCAHAIGIPGNSQAYEIGVVKRPGGTFKLVWDFWNGGFGLEKVAGKDCSKLVQSYASEVCKKHLKAQGYSLGTTKLNDQGEIEMIFTQY